jgi:CRISPR type III-A-associated protein Csm2
MANEPLGSWQNYLDGGYFESETVDLRPDYVSRDKVDRLVQQMARDGLTMSQLRRFFQHCRAIEAKLRGNTASWRAVEADFRKIDVAAADAFGKKPPKIPRLFHDFIRCNVAAVKSEDDFLKGFLPHFEALVGYGSQHLKERDRS